MTEIAVEAEKVVEYYTGNAEITLGFEIFTLDEPSGTTTSSIAYKGQLINNENSKLTRSIE